MKEYNENGYRVQREKSKIIVEKDNGQKSLFDLVEKSSSIGKINIPLSNICTMECLYCSEAEYNRKQRISLDSHISHEIIDAYIEWISNYPEIKEVRLSFDYGGEPVCQLNILEDVVCYFRKKCQMQELKSIVLLTTNGAWDKKLLPRVIDCADEIIVSLDGPKALHEKYRKYKNECSVFDLIVKNTLEIKRVGKLKHISSVITQDTIKQPEKYIRFFMELFPYSTIKISAVIMTGNAIKNGVERVPLKDWKKFVCEINHIVDGKITIIDSKPEKKCDYKYIYGCEHMRMTNWFYWLDGKISCCTDRENTNYYIGYVKDEILKMDYLLMHKLKKYNAVENIEKCKGCLAKYYCCGGCPEFREDKLNCEKRVEKYAKIFIQKSKI